MRRNSVSPPDPATPHSKAEAALLGERGPYLTETHTTALVNLPLDTGSPGGSSRSPLNRSSRSRSRQRQAGQGHLGRAPVR
jgi:hypothetical protein